ncbi:hypothetical protein RB195_019033 [Necator americanus]|uniref:LIM zinc-binding domain-containing protein n=1 Tax=Necator americanus TaxID=51031 RepID=A0ABR1CCA5_NECAM
MLFKMSLMLLTVVRPLMLSCCFEGIDVKYVEAMGKFWHRTCLQCSICLQPLNRVFVENDRGLPMHGHCCWKELLYKEVVLNFSTTR